MPIRVTLDKVMAQRGIRGRELAQKIGITEANLSLLRNGKVKGLRFQTLAALCAAMNCQPGDLLSYEPGDEDASGPEDGGA
ncbi:helix-turn-helix domain-containing protein [Azospirillum soli]|uniref:helix-turn-helix domain-containing protein n=1 Tax=Azospirillum soli TaxID=1304799 RepID=UPI001AE246CD|nr:helix-turn-helix transcriptional regulator [Azospirillum soli]MBP2310942.1 putative transcriptional regulator [Azospirillum soli]